MIVFKKVNGRAVDIRRAPEGYEPAPDELVIDPATLESDALPTSADLSDPPSLEAARAARWQALKAARDAARDGGFLFAGKVLQSDDVSRANIAGAAFAASLAKSAGAPYAITWTAADNSTIALTADQVIGLFMAGAAHVQAVYDRGVLLREQLGAAATVEEIEAIVW